MIKNRQKKLKELMAKNKVECLILFPGVDMFYTTGIRAHPSERLMSTILPIDKEPIYICPSFERSRIEKSISNEGEIRTWEEDENPFKLFGNTIIELGLEKKKIALDNKLWFEWFLKIQKAIPKGKFVDSVNIVQQARLIKSEEEIAILKEATEIAAKSIIGGFEEAQLGMTELEIARIVSEKLKKASGEVAFCIVQTGPNTAIPHGGPTERKLEQNDVLLIDAGPIHKGYVGDITMTFAIGTPSEKFRKIYDTVFRANREAFTFAREGVTAEAVDKIARDIITKEGFGQHFTHRLGHGLGVEGHEPPYLVKGNKLILQEGMCHTIEPGIYLPGEFGVRIEDDAVIRKTHCEILYETPRRVWE